MEHKKTRNSSIELLKIIAIILIVLSHSMPDGDTTIHEAAINIDSVTTNISLIIAGFIKNVGQIGNVIFLISSAWFLIDSNKVKSSKVVSMIGDCFFISMGMLTIFTVLGYNLPIKYLIKQFFPVTFSNHWYLTCYLLLYMIHPFLNCAIKGIRQESLLCFNICFFILYNCMGFLMSNSLFYYSNLIGFIGIYFFIAYIKLYMTKSFLDNKLNYILLCIGMVGWILSSALTAFLGNYIVFFENQMQHWNNFMNPCFLFIAIGLFGIAKNRTFYSKRINYLSSLSLLIYMIHTTRILRDYVRFDIFKYIKNVYGYNNLLLWILLFAVSNLVFGIIIAIVYNKTVQKYIHSLFVRTSQIMSKIYKYLENRILRLD